MWQRGRGHRFARASIDAHLKLVGREANQGRYHNAAESARRALSLAFVLGDKALTNKVIKRVTEISEDWVKQASDPGPYFATEIINKILSKSRFRDESILKRWVSLVEEALRMETEHHSRKALLAQLEKVLDRLGRHEDARQCQVKIGEEWEAEAHERETKSAMEAAVFYEHALKAYVEAGASEKVEAMKLATRESYQMAEETEFGTISHQVEIDLADWNKQVSEWLKLPVADALKSLAAYLPLIPAWRTAEKIAAELRNEAPLSQMIPWKTLDSGRPISEPKTDAEQHLDNVRRQYNLLVVMNRAWLSTALALFRENGFLTGDSLVQHISDSPVFPDHKIKVIRRGFERYVEADHISAIHILVPHLEDCLRRFLSELGGDTTSYRPGKMREKSLQEVLEAEQIKQALAMISAELWRYFEHVLVAETGLNLRNDVAHGLLRAEELNADRANIVVHFYLLLGLWPVREDDEG